MRTIISRLKKKHDYVATIGVFDGMHLGHLHLLRRLAATAHCCKLPSLLITFWPHPEQVLRGKKFKGCITSLAGKEQLLRSSGLDYFWVLHTSKKLLRLEGESFLRKIIQRVGLKAVVVGSDFRFGYRARSTINDLKRLSGRFGFEVQAIDKYTIDGQVVSSSLIRQCISQGKIEEANRYLGRCFSLEGAIIRGKGVGRQLGFPTINLFVPGIILPRKGVYAVSLSLGDRVYKGACNIGTAPTVSGARKTSLEVHILNYHACCRRKKATVFFHARIRDEERFSSHNALSRAIARDIAVIEKFFQAHHIL